jgi:hypothetical protein
MKLTATPITRIITGSIIEVRARIFASTSLLVAVRRLGQHPVERAALLPHGHHLHQHGRKPPATTEKLRQAAAFLEFRAGLVDLVGEDDVVDDVTDDLQRGDERYPGLEEAGQGAAETGRGRLDGEVAQAGEGEFEPVPAAPARRCGEIPAQPGQHGQHGHQHRPPEASQEAAHGDEQHRGQGQGLLGALEHRGDARHDEGDQQKQHHHPDQGHEQRIKHGRADARAQGVLVFAELGQPVEDHVERARGLAGAHHVDVDAGEEFGMLGQGRGERVALVDRVLDLGEDGAEGAVAGLFDQAGERRHERDAGAEQGGQLAGGHVHLLRFAGGDFTRSFLEFYRVMALAANFLPGSG